MYAYIGVCKSFNLALLILRAIVWYWSIWNANFFMID